jgi:hypothetical protein
MPRLNGLDAGFLFGEAPERHMHVGGIVVLDALEWGHAPVDVIRTGTRRPVRTGRHHRTRATRRILPSGGRRRGAAPRVVVRSP